MTNRREVAYEYLHCKCNSPDCDVRFMTVHYFPKDEPEDLYVNVQLNNYAGFFTRLKLAVRYVLNRVEDDVHWGECIVDYTSAIRVRDFLDQHIQRVDEWATKVTTKEAEK